MSILDELEKNRIEGRPVVYLDETWASVRDSVEKMWVEDDPVLSCVTIGGFCKMSGKRRRVIILHAGEENGWIDGAAFVFPNKKATVDYQ